MTIFFKPGRGVRSSGGAPTEEPLTTKKSSRNGYEAKKKRCRKRPAALVRACARLRSRAVVADEAAGGCTGGGT